MVDQPQRWCLVSECSCPYLLRVEEVQEFEELRDCGELDQLETIFGGRRIDDVYGLTFTDPRTID